MAQENSRVRINLQTGEVEIEGTEDFVNEQGRKLKTLVKNLREASETTEKAARKTTAAAGGRRVGRPPKKAKKAAKKAKQAPKKAKKVPKKAKKAPKKAKKAVGRPKKKAAAKVAKKAAAKRRAKAKAKGRPKAAAKRKAKARAKKAAGKAAPKKAAGPSADHVKAMTSALKKMSDKASDVDRLLVAGYIVASSDGDHTFSTRDANRLLGAAGVKIRNAAQAAIANISANRLVKVDRGRFRFTDDGFKHAKSLAG